MILNLNDRNRLNSFILLFPIMLILFLTIILPALWALISSFYQFKLAGPRTPIGFGNFKKIFTDVHGFWNSLQKTGLFLVLIVSGELLFGLAFSLLLSRGFPLQRLWVALIISPLAVSPVIAIIVWKYMFAPDYGMINYIISRFGMQAPSWFTSGLHAFIAVCIIDIWLSTPFVVTILYPTIISISPTLFDAAKIDGASYFQMVSRITLPLIKPAILTTLSFRIIFGLRLFSPVWLFAGGGPTGATKVLSIYLYEQGFTYWHLGLGCAIAMVLLIITMIIATPQIRAMQKVMF